MLHATYVPLLAAIIVMGVSLIGVLFSARALREWMHRNSTYLATFSGGVFLLVVYHLLSETLVESSSLALAAGAILFGAALMQALHRMLPNTHHHHGLTHDHAHTHIDGRRVLISDAFHNIGDGVLLVAAFAVSFPVGIAAAIGIIIHESVQEISEYFVLKEAGYTSRQALGYNFLSSSTILIGIALATFLASAETISVLFAGIAAGGFLTILAQDLIPHAVHAIKREGGIEKHAVAALLGIALMLLVQSVFSHEEEVPEDDLTTALTAMNLFARASLQSQDTLN